MNKFIPGLIVAAVGVILGGALYKTGYHKGVDDCRRIVQTAIDVKEAVQESEDKEQ